VKKLLLLLACAILFFVACNSVKANNMDKDILVGLLPTPDDIPVPPWFT